MREQYCHHCLRALQYIPTREVPVPQYKRTFEYSDLYSDKFWSIWRSGPTVYVVFGKIGTKGVTQQKAMKSPVEAAALVEKKITEKLRKGYEEV